LWINAEQALAAMPYDLRRKLISGNYYLYEIFDRGGNGKSRGRWTDETAHQLEDYRSAKAREKERRDNGRVLLDESARLYRASRLPLLSRDAGPILREADRRQLLGSHLLVVGTNAMLAYSIEAGGLIIAPDETEDFDLAWVAEAADSEAMQVWELLKAVDLSFTINSERDFQARNAKAYEVELLVAPSRAGSLAAKDRPRPMPLPEQEWLLLDRLRRPSDWLPRRLPCPHRHARSALVCAAQAVDGRPGQTQSLEAPQGSQTGYCAAQCRGHVDAALSAQWGI
jgi:Nucleotidyltransferase